MVRDPHERVIRHYAGILLFLLFFHHLGAPFKFTDIASRLNLLDLRLVWLSQ